MVTQNPFNDYMKMFSEFKPAPAIDQNEMVSFCRRNAEAVSNASSVMSEGAQLVTRRQAELMRDNVAQMLNSAKDMMANGSPEINPTKQTELAKSVFEASLNNFREASEMMAKSSFEAFDLINKRATQSMEEINSLSKKSA